MDKQTAKKVEKYLKTCKTFAEVIHGLMKQDGLMGKGKLFITIGEYDMSFGTQEIAVRYDHEYTEGQYVDNMMSHMYLSKVSDENNNDYFQVGWNDITGSSVLKLLEDEE